MTRSRVSLRHVLGGIALCWIAGGASAQPVLSDAQSRYIGAHVFERQVEVFRRYCAGDAQAAERLEAGIAEFRAGNPDFEAALAVRPEGADFVAGVDAFDARFDDMAEAMHAYLALQPAQARCATIADNLGGMRFTTMIDEANDSAAAALTASAP